MTNLTDIFCLSCGAIAGTVATYFFLRLEDKKIVRAIERAQKRCSLKINSKTISSLDKMFKLGESTAYNKILNLLNGKKKEIEE